MLANQEEAIKYLTITTEMNNKDKQYKKYKREYNHSEFILDLVKLKKSSNLEANRQIDPDNLKHRSDSIKTFKLQDLEKIAYSIDENIITLKEAIDKFNLTEEQILLIKLIRARNFYIDKIPQAGDQLVKDVERNKNKTLQVIYFLDEIKRNKKMYLNRFDRYVKTKNK